MFDISKFNEELSDIWSTIVGALMSFVPDRDAIEKVFFLGESTDKMCTCNCLYQIDGQILNQKGVIDKKGLSEEKHENGITSILFHCIEELTRMRDLFEKTNQEPPKSIKIIYDARKGSLDTEFSYAPITTDDYGMYEAVCDWQEELKAALSAEQG